MRHRPVSRSKRQPCSVHVSSHPSTSPNTARSALRCGQRRCTTQSPSSMSGSVSVGGCELAHRLGLGAAHPLARQRLEEVVDVLVELARPATPGSGTTGTASCSSRRPARRRPSRPAGGRCRSGSRTARRRRRGPRRRGSRSRISTSPARSRQAAPTAAAHGRGHGQQRLPPRLQRRQQVACAARRPRRLQLVEPRQPVGLVARAGTRPCRSKIAVDLVVGDRMGDVDRLPGLTSIAVPGIGQEPDVTGRRRAARGTRAGRRRCSARRP